MAIIREITDINAQELDVYARLTEAQLRNRLEPDKGIFIAESPKVIRTAIAEGYEPISFLMERRHITGQAEDILESYPMLECYTGDETILEKLTGYRLTRGVLCAMRRPSPLRREEVIKDAKRIAVLENIVDSTNIGAIFRSAAALGMDAVLLSPSCSDPYNRRAVRVSMGTVFQIPWCYISEDRSDWPIKGIEWLRENGFKTAAMALSDNSVSIDDENLRREEKLAVILGTEGDGLENSTIDGCDYTVKIPMFHGVDSLNVAAASAVTFYAIRKN